MKRYASGIEIFRAAASTLAHKVNQCSKAYTHRDFADVQGASQEDIENVLKLGMGIAIPHMVLRAFEVELCLKAALEGNGQDPDSEIMRSHNLKKLFKNLPDERTGKVKQTINDPEFDRKLTECGNNFQELRYFFEDKSVQTTELHSKFLSKLSRLICLEFDEEIKLSNSAR